MDKLEHGDYIEAYGASLYEFRELKLIEGDFNRGWLDKGKINNTEFSSYEGICEAHGLFYNKDSFWVDGPKNKGALIPHEDSERINKLTFEDFKRKCINTFKQ